MLKNKCPQCGSFINVDAMKCRCGWKDETKPPVAMPAPGIPCAFDGCSWNAICRVWTCTGWANVCRSCYVKADVVPRRVEGNPFVDACRAALAAKKSPAVRERIPGEDDDLPLGIARDALEAEFQA